MSSDSSTDIVELSPVKFLLGCSVVSLAIVFIGRVVLFPAWLVALEVFITVIALFVLGSVRYRLDKNALTYGAVLIIIATFWEPWWTSSTLQQAVQIEGASALWHFIRHHFLTLHGLDNLIHADTMLFILGLTFFVAVIAQTRILESVSFTVLQKTKGNVVFTVAILAAIVSFSSGILDGVSMIGLMIRTLVIILFLAKAYEPAVIYAVIISTVITTVCGMWLAYGEPPNLIMKSNLHPYLENAFFLRYCLPVAVGSYFIVLWNIRRRLKGEKINIKKLDVLDVNTADVRFLQASRHGKVLSPIEFVLEHKEKMGDHVHPIIERLQRGEPLGKAFIRENMSEKLRRELLGIYVTESLSDELDEHYRVAAGKSDDEEEDEHSLMIINRSLHIARKKRLVTQKIGALSFIPFIGLLVWHAIDHDVPLFLASFAGFVVAFIGIANIPKMRNLALREAKHEYSEYLFLFPLFLSITLLQKTGFFSVLSDALHHGIERFGASVLALVQFAGATFLSAMLDNNVVADFAGRAIKGLDVGILHLFAMAQIAGYAVGGCWTHIGSAQSVVAYAFIRKEINEKYTPFQWIKAMTPVVLELFIWVTVVVLAEGWLLSVLPEH